MVHFPQWKETIKDALKQHSVFIDKDTVWKQQCYEDGIKLFYRHASYVKQYKHCLQLSWIFVNMQVAMLLISRRLSFTCLLQKLAIVAIFRQGNQCHLLFHFTVSQSVGNKSIFEWNTEIVDDVLTIAKVVFRKRKNRQTKSHTTKTFFYY